jgi:hypothetical protein
VGDENYIIGVMFPLSFIKQYLHIGWGLHSFLEFPLEGHMFLGTSDELLDPSSLGVTIDLSSAR